MAKKVILTFVYILHLCEELSKNVQKCHSSYTTPTTGTSRSRVVSRSDANIYSIKNSFGTTTASENMTKYANNTFENSERNYYKRYEHDEIPVKDDSSYNDHSFSEDNISIGAENKDSITNSDLDKLEMKILRKMSQELQTDDNSLSSLDSNIKLFKSTVQQILDNFYTNMEDFEEYKKKFNDILEKNKGDSFSEMENFIRDIIQHIGSSESSMYRKKANNESAIRDETKEETRTVKTETDASNTSGLNSTMETFKNNNYFTDSTFENNSSKPNATIKKDDIFNIYLLSTIPCVEIKMTNRNMLSEINIKNNSLDDIENQLASAENIKKLAAKKLQLKKYAIEKQEHATDRDIPIRISNAKKNIYLDEDFATDEKDESKFFIFKICSYLCKKFRKNSLG